MLKSSNWLIFLLLLVFPLTNYAEDTNGESNKMGDNKLNVNEIIFGHVGDSYEWHITEWHDNPVAITLPVIVYSKATGWHTFSSKRLRDGQNYRGFQYGNALGKNKDKVVEIINGTEVRPIDISITKNVLGLFANCAVLLIVILSVSRWYKKNSEEKVPTGFRGAMDMFIMSINDNVIKACVGENYKKFAPYLLTAFFFIFFSNVMGLIPIFPGGANITGNIAVTMVMAIFTFCMVNFFGTKEYWKDILWPEVPTWLKVPIPLLPVIELFGIFTKPFALMIRLFANILAGHSIVLGLVCVIFLTVSLGPAINAGMSVVSLLFMIFMDCLELLVAFIQAYVFTMLSSVFIGMAQVNKKKQN